MRETVTELDRTVTAPRTSLGRVDHWEEIYRTRSEEEMSWRQPRPSLSMRLIAQYGRPTDRILDAGGGTSYLAENLWAEGYRRVSVLDISKRAIARAKGRLAPEFQGIRWRAGDLTQTLRLGHCELWHDRAVFHFLVRPRARDAYLKNLDRALVPGGTVVLAAFALDGPETCSGLPVERYSATKLAHTLGPDYRLVTHRRELHRTPWGTVQPFTFAVLRRKKRIATERRRAAGRNSRAVRNPKVSKRTRSHAPTIGPRSR